MSDRHYEASKFNEDEGLKEQSLTGLVERPIRRANRRVMTVAIGALNASEAQRAPKRVLHISQKFVSRKVYELNKKSSPLQ